MTESNDPVGDEFRQIYSCELCNNKTSPTFTLEDAERRNARPGAFIIRRHKVTGEETRRSVLCVQCMRKTGPESICNADEKPFMSFVRREGIETQTPGQMTDKELEELEKRRTGENVEVIAKGDFKPEDLEIIYDEILKRVYEQYKLTPRDKIVNIYNKSIQDLYREKYPPLMQYLVTMKEEPIRDEDIPSSVGYFQDYTKPTSLHYFTDKFVENQGGIARGMAERLNRERKPQRYADEER